MIPYGRHFVDEADIKAVVDILRGAPLTQGPAVERFERAVADYVGARYAVAVSSGTAALHLAAQVAGVGPGRTLVTTPITFVASANAGRYLGADVDFADIDSATVNMSASALEEILAARQNVRAVIPVHFAGLPCDMPAIQAQAYRAGAAVIEDAAHAMGATYPNGRRVGCCDHSEMTIFSFHPVKAIAAGEGGMITTNDDQFYRSLLRLRSHGINKLNDPLIYPEQAVSGGEKNPWYYEMQELGFNYRITDLQCALALSQLGKLEGFLARRRALANRYDQAFAGLAHCRPAQGEGRELSGHHLYVLRIDFATLGITRAHFMNTLRAQGIGTQVHYIPVPAQPYYRALGARPENYPHAQAYYEQAISIPFYYGLSDEQQDAVVTAVKALVR